MSCEGSVSLGECKLRYWHAPYQMDPRRNTERRTQRDLPAPDKACARDHRLHQGVEAYCRGSGGDYKEAEIQFHHNQSHQSSGHPLDQVRFDFHPWAVPAAVHFHFADLLLDELINKKQKRIAVHCNQVLADIKRRQRDKERRGNSRTELQRQEEPQMRCRSIRLLSEFHVLDRNWCSN